MVVSVFYEDQTVQSVVGVGGRVAEPVRFRERVTVRIVPEMPLYIIIILFLLYIIPLLNSALTIFLKVL